jgi:hypothetical protein
MCSLPAISGQSTRLDPWTCTWAQSLRTHSRQVHLSKLSSSIGMLKRLAGWPSLEICGIGQTDTKSSSRDPELRNTQNQRLHVVNIRLRKIRNQCLHVFGIWIFETKAYAEESQFLALDRECESRTYPIEASEYFKLEDSCLCRESQFSWQDVN